MWNSLGGPPEKGELEISVLGPGFGECVAAHIGDDHWFIVDSCFEPKVPAPAPIRYLTAIGKDPAHCVKGIVATHWDRDHIGGIASVLSQCKGASFICAKAFSTKEFHAYVAAHRVGPNKRGVDDIHAAFDELLVSGRSIRAAYPGRNLATLKLADGNGTFRLWSLSPSDAEYDLFVAEASGNNAKLYARMKAAVGRTPNLASVVLVLEWADQHCVLLGADMESHSAPERGWKAVVAQAALVACSKSALVKIPHHGSKTGHAPEMWADLLHPNPLSVLAPFSKGNANSRPPTKADIARISALSSALYVTSPHTSARGPARNAGVVRGLRETNIQMRSQQPSMGIVRFRRKVGAKDWQVEMFGRAKKAT